MKAWKHPFLQQFFPQKHFHFVPFQLTERLFQRKVLPLLQAPQKPVVFVWSNNLPDFAAKDIARLGLDVFFMEDGFIRSLDAHAGYSVPLSLSLDSKRPYFDARGQSDLEELLASYDFENDPALMQRAREGMNAVLRQRLTKYNGHLSSPQTPAAKSSSSKKKVLVIGQVEEDASILYGCNQPFTNNDLIRLAAVENPEAEIVYKPHPDVLSRMRREISNPDDVANLCTVLRGKVSLPDALDAADHVYTITSLAGFEALMRGKKVTVIGAPFYAGWGLTDDRQSTGRRGRGLSLEALFAGAYVVYPLYFEPRTGEPSTFGKTVSYLESPHPGPRILSSEPLQWKLYGTYGVLGWRHLLTPLIAKIVAIVGNERDAAQFRINPAGFLREQSRPLYRRLGRLLYPWNIQS
ncbi:hypothetical protein [Agrobacterium sp. DSM 25558]|uniref:capsular polysaccharide export protein, LipB/KpsS family n=1 Tax=Agrobacterium sp. DSM 25558 TaxID=1907665 RepID=UPI00097CF592|nr:hypothetical protein [Agrobacterium sp. DSM 25558]